MSGDKELSEGDCTRIFLNTLGLAEDALQNYYDHLKDHDKSYQCHKNFKNSAIIVFCEQCGRSQSNLARSCICVPCYLNSNHKGHNVSYYVTENFICDCGNPVDWDPDNTCSLHKKPTTSEDTLTLDSDERSILEKAIKSSITSTCCPFEIFSQLVNIGSGISHLISQSLIEIMDFDKTFRTFVHWETDQTSRAINFFCSMLIENDFSIYYGEAFLDYYQDFLTDTIKAVTKDCLSNEVANYAILAQTAFSFFTKRFISHSKKFLEPEKYNLVSWIQEKIKILLECRFLPLPKFKEANILRETINYMAGLVQLIAEQETTKHLLPEILKIIFNYSYVLENDFTFTKVINDYDNDETMMGLVYYYLGLLPYSVFNYMGQKDLFTKTVLEEYYLFLENKILQGEKQDEDYGGVLDGETEITPCLSLHSALSYFLWTNLENAKNILTEFCQQKNMDLNYFLRMMSLLVVRHFATTLLAMLNCFKGTSEFSIRAVFFSIVPLNVNNILKPLFRLIQMCFAMTDEKGKFLEMIWKTFSQKSDISYKEQIQNSFVYFLDCLLFDRLIFKNDDLTMRRITYSNKLKIMGRCKFNDIKYPGMWNETRLEKDFFDYAVMEKSNAGNFYKLKSDKYVSPFAIWISLRDNLKLQSMIIKGDRFLTAPEFEDIGGYGFGKVFDEPILEEILSDFFVSNNATAINMSLPIIKNMSNLSPHFTSIICGSTVGEKFLILEGKIKSENSEEISEKPPNSIQKSIMLNYMKDNELDELLNFDEEEDDSDHEKHHHHDHDENDINQTCFLCLNDSKTSHLCYPVYFTKTTVYSEIEYKLCGSELKENKKLPQLVMCQHLIHRMCIDSQVEVCPIDKDLINAALPIIKDVNQVDVSTESDINEFVKMVFCNNEDPEKMLEKRFENILSLLCRHLSISEVRYRTNPKCYKQESFYLITENLYKIAKFLKKKDNVSKIFGNDIFETIVFDYLFDDINSNEFTNLLKDLKPLRLFVILRRVEILKNVILKETETVNFENILTSENLMSKYKVNLENVTLQKYTLDLPKNYIDIFRDERCQNAFVFDASWFKILQSDRIIEYESLKSLEKLNEANPMLVFAINERIATEVFIISTNPRAFLGQKSVYLNEYGEENIGVKSNGFLTLSEERCDEIIDDYLSGEWMHQLSREQIQAAMDIFNFGD